MKHKFKIGDKVKIASKKEYKNIHYIDPFEMMYEKEVIIKRLVPEEGWFLRSMPTYEIETDIRTHILEGELWGETEFTLLSSQLELEFLDKK